MIATLHLCSRSRVPSFSSFGPRSLPNWAAVAVFASASCSSPVGLDEDADGHDADPDETVESHDGPAEGGTDEGAEGTGRPPDGPRHCGNGIVDPGEDCDDGNRLNGDDCDWRCEWGPTVPPDNPPDPAIDDTDTLELATGRHDVAPTTARPAAYFDGRGVPLVWAETDYATTVILTDWEPNPAGASDAEFLRIGLDGHLVGTGWRLHEPGRPFGALDLTWNGNDFGLLWCGGAVGSDLYFVELDRQGKPRYDAVTLAEDVGVCEATVVWDGASYGCFWTDEAAAPEAGVVVRYLRVLPLGIAVGEPRSLHASALTQGLALRAATSGTTHAVAFIDDLPGCRHLGGGHCVGYVIMEPAGDNRFVSASLGPAMGKEIGLAWDGTEAFGIAWNSQWPGVEGIHLARVAESGLLWGPPQPLDTHCGVETRDSCARAMGLDLAFGRNGWVVAFYRIEEVVGLIRTDRFGVATDSASVTLEAPSEVPLSVAFDGAGFGVLAASTGSMLGFARWEVGP